MKKVFAAFAVAAMFIGCAGSSNNEIVSESNNNNVQTPERAASLLAQMTEVKTSYTQKKIPAGLGIAESRDDQIAREKAETYAIADLGASVQAEIKSVTAMLSQEIDGEYVSVFENSTKESVNTQIYGATTVKEVKEETPEGKVKVYVVMVLRTPGFVAKQTRSFIDQMVSEGKLESSKGESLRSFYELDPEFE